MSKQEIPDGWSEDGLTFIHYGMGYRIKKDLTQVCVGPVDANGEPVKKEEISPEVEKLVKETPLKAPDALPEEKETVSKIKDDIIYTPGIMKQVKIGRGRPKKSGDELSRTTFWRREKEKQGVLL